MKKPEPKDFPPESPHDIVFPVYEFRPLDTSRKLLRYNGGNWIKDDGEYDICFITDDNLGAPFCYYISLPYKTNLQWSWAKNGNWSAHVQRHPDGNAWHYQSKNGSANIWESWDGRDKHPNIEVGDKGSDKLCKKYGCSNGRGPEFHIGDPYIIAGVLREKETKKVVTFPETFHCIYCGDHDLSQVDMTKQLT